MTFKELNSKLPFSYKGKLVEKINDLEVDFYEKSGMGAVAYGFYLRDSHEDKNVVATWYEQNVQAIIIKYLTDLSESDRKKAYLYIYYDAKDFPILCLGVKK